MRSRLAAVVVFLVVGCSQDQSQITNPSLQFDAVGGRSLVITDAPAHVTAGAAFNVTAEFRSAQGKLLPVGEKVTATFAGATFNGRADKGVVAFTGLAANSAGTYSVVITSPGAQSAAASITVTPVNVCTYTVTPSAIGFGDAGGSFGVDVTTQSACTWTPISDSSWMIVDDATQHTGNGHFNVSVATLAHSSPVRSGRIELWNPYPTVDTSVGTSVTQDHNAH